MKQYRLKKDFCGVEKGEVFETKYTAHPNIAYSKIYSFHIDIINALPEVFEVVPQKKTVYVGIGTQIEDIVNVNGRYDSTMAYLNKGDCEAVCDTRGSNYKVYPVEIEVSE